MSRIAQVFAAGVLLMATTAGIRAVTEPPRPIHYGRLLTKWIECDPATGDTLAYWVEVLQPEPDVPKAERGPWMAVVPAKDYHRLDIGDAFRFRYRDRAHIDVFIDR